MSYYIDRGHHSNQESIIKMFTFDLVILFKEKHLHKHCINKRQGWSRRISYVTVAGHSCL